MNLAYFYFLEFAALISFSLLLQQPLSTDAVNYAINNHQTPAKRSSSSENVSEPIRAARSLTECVLRCRNKAGEQDKSIRPFYTDQNECFCLEDDQQEVDTLTKENGENVDGSLLAKVRIFVDLFNIYTI